MNAVISPCGKYRYELKRDINPIGSLTYAFFGVNPSTADASIDDATIRKLKGFTSRWYARDFIVGNVFAYRSTDVKNLSTADDPVGPWNIIHLKKIIDQADVLVPCWGSRDKIPKEHQHNLDVLADILKTSGKTVMTFGFTKSGDPKHPLMLGYNTELQEWQ